jgi:hypothetical protein
VETEIVKGELREDAPVIVDASGPSA